MVGYLMKPVDGHVNVLFGLDDKILLEDLKPVVKGLHENHGQQRWWDVDAAHAESHGIFPDLGDHLVKRVLGAHVEGDEAEEVRVYV